MRTWWLVIRYAWATRTRLGGVKRPGASTVEAIRRCRCLGCDEMSCGLPGCDECAADQ